MAIEQEPTRSRKTYQSERADCCAHRIDRGRLRCSPFSVESGFLLLDDFMSFDQCRAGWKNGREVEEQNSHAWSKTMGDYPSRDCDQTTGEESHCVFVRLSGTQIRRVKRGDHCQTRCK